MHLVARLPPVLIVLTLLLSVAYNLRQHIVIQRLTNSKVEEAPSFYAGLRRARKETIHAQGVWFQNNQTAEDEAWSTNELNINHGLVALDDSFVSKKGIPLAQRWPWDKSKGIYFVDGIHNLHCLKYLRKSVLEAFSGSPQSGHLHHAKHCLQTLLLSLKCESSDYLRYTGSLHENADNPEPPSGEGQVRMCRDWTELIRWTEENSACYDPNVPSDGSWQQEFERYKACPNGDKPWMEV